MKVNNGQVKNIMNDPYYNPDDKSPRIGFLTHTELLNLIRDNWNWLTKTSKGDLANNTFFGSGASTASDISLTFLAVNEVQPFVAPQNLSVDSVVGPVDDSGGSVTAVFQYKVDGTTQTVPFNVLAGQVVSTKCTTHPGVSTNLALVITLSEPAGVVAFGWAANGPCPYLAGRKTVLTSFTGYKDLDGSTVSPTVVWKLNGSTISAPSTITLDVGDVLVPDWTGGASSATFISLSCAAEFI